jgi:protein O-GlcNAc transferase
MRVRAIVNDGGSIRDDSQALRVAIQHHQTGRLAEAEALLRQILAVQPNHADAFHILGIIAHQAGRDDLAGELIRQAIVFNPNNPVAHSNLGNALVAQGHLDEAIAAYRRALQLKPDYPEAHNNLGSALRDRGHLDEAIAACRRALQIKPDFAEAHNNLGNALRDRGHLDEAIASCRCALQIKPDFAEAHNNLGNALKDQGQIDEAVAAYRRALQLRPDYPEVHNNLGNALTESGRLDEAIASYRRALQVKPDFPAVNNNLGNALRDRGQIDEAIASYRRALQIEPGHSDTHNNLGAALAERGRLDEAIASYRHALQIRPDFAEAHNNLGLALSDRGQLDEAIASYRCALQIKSDYPDAHNGLGDALKSRGELDEAIAAFRRAMRLKPDDTRFQSNLIYALHFHPGKDDITIAEEQRSWNRRFGEPAKQFILPHANDRNLDRRLRIGYVSPDYRDHVVGRSLLPLFERHDRDQVEVLCYSGVVWPDWMTERFRGLAGEWRSTVGVSDARLAEIIREDGVDILVDLAQQMAGNRLPVFARKPAPVQVSFAGYPESTGLEAIEYRISDRYLEAGVAKGRSETKEQLCLIDSFWCYDPCGMEVKVNTLPALETKTLTFGSLGNFGKVNEPVLKLWAQVLGIVKNSLLLIWSPMGSHRQRTTDALEKEGVKGDRVRFVEFRPRREYLEAYHEVDIVLDTFPYNGHTTSLDALWMGVPVVSLAGETPVSRAGLSQLSNLGLPELVAHSEGDYVRIAVELAGDIPRLAKLRSTLRGRMENSVLMDAPRFTRQVEQAYRSMWKRWCAAGD